MLKLSIVKAKKKFILLNKTGLGKVYDLKKNILEQSCFKSFVLSK
jgi:hypothetical protein